MKFYVPFTEDDIEAETIWTGVREHLLDQGLPTTRRRIQALSLEEGRPDLRLEIGMTTPKREPVLLIFEASDIHGYYICTPNQGVLRGEPYAIGLGGKGRAIDFDEGPIERLWGAYLK